ncbi:D-xylose transport system substrate-binding protein [Ruminiclostridium sufflavum DSM 19573]|uniref:D-xylose transport system substrate-binding protein n=1 Tax=Ruminiclostridium sufflavum DSM 19573 TaxID=1121337 RepID=A0A318XLH4_9FIRM|nr:substrate-binding domain-containing protein [Ruminiclostridium sufflavum]PYG87435.1 D-xylose transport system substrate-binding protein [Ruminiclostridium sufflavum DSM 19573]
MKMTRNLKRMVLIFMSLITVIILLAACNSTDSESADTGIKEDKIQIGMCFDSFVIERWQLDRDVFVAAAKGLGAEVNVQNANGDVNKQKEQIEYFINKNIDALVIIPIDSEAISKVVLEARNAGIKIISYDRLIKNANANLYISFDNEKVGEMMAEAMVSAGLPNKSVLMLCGSPMDNNVSLVKKGFSAVMNDNNIYIIDIAYAKNWRAELAASYIYDNVDKVKIADAIMFGNDDLATQGVRALSEKRLIDKVKVVGQDADLAACQRIAEGTQLMTVYKPVDKLAKQAAEYAVKLIQGNKLEDMQTIYDGTYDVPYIALEPIAVNRDNMDEVIIDSGFHLKEDVYLNVPQNKR